MKRNNYTDEQLLWDLTQINIVGWLVIVITACLLLFGGCSPPEDDTDTDSLAVGMGNRIPVEATTATTEVETECEVVVGTELDFITPETGDWDTFHLTLWGCMTARNVVVHLTEPVHLTEGQPFILRITHVVSLREYYAEVG